MATEVGIDLDRLFYHLKEFGQFQFDMIGEYPKKLVISPLLLQRMSKIPGFFQREELRNAMVTQHSPIVRLVRFTWGVVTIVEDFEEIFMHFE